MEVCKSWQMMFSRCYTLEMGDHEEDAEDNNEDDDGERGND